MVACLVENLGGEIWVILGMNRVAVARNGLKLWENGAGRFRKAMGYLPELWDSIKNPKTAKSPEIGKLHIYIYIYGAGGRGRSP